MVVWFGILFIWILYMEKGVRYLSYGMFVCVIDSNNES